MRAFSKHVAWSLSAKSWEILEEKDENSQRNEEAYPLDPAQHKTVSSSQELRL